MGKNVYTNVHGNIIQNSSKVETTKIDTNWWMYISKMCYILSMEYYSAEKGNEALTHATHDVFETCYVKEASHKIILSYDSIYMRWSAEANI